MRERGEHQAREKRGERWGGEEEQHAVCQFTLQLPIILLVEAEAGSLAFKTGLPGALREPKYLSPHGYPPRQSWKLASEARGRGPTLGICPNTPGH